jgi:O-acetyl-ADP-ribose deacetylase (regulator of RNase III)
LAYSALPNLNDSTVIGEALKNVGGETYAAACRTHTNVPPGDVVCTPGGDLACHYVFHAVGCHLKGRKKNSEEVCLSPYSLHGEI